METVIGKSYFNDPKILKENKIKKISQFPYLEEDIKCEVLIIGGGIQGSILNYYLAQNCNVVLVDSGRIANNSTTIATALLEFQLDDFAKDLEKYMSKEDIVDVYKMGKNSIDKIEELVHKFGNNCNFARRPALLYSNRICDINKIKDEYTFRINNNFDCEYIDENNNQFDFDIKAGILDNEGGAEFNPYLFAKEMIENSDNKDSIYENTEIISIEHNKNKIICTTKYGNTITCNKVIIASGFDIRFITQEEKKNIINQVSYSIVTKPINKLANYKRTLIQDTLDNYHYLRILPDNRIIFGGEDTPFNGDEIDVNLCKKKYNSLIKNLKKIFKNIEDEMEIEYSFAGLFASTDNNLGIIGESQNKNIYYFLSCGANGIINTFCGVEIIEDLLNGRKHKLSRLFSPTRNL